MANLWQCQKQHLIKTITSTKDFWELLVDPLFNSFEQAPLVYSYLLKIISIQFAISLKKPEGQEDFFKAVGKFLCGQKQLRLFQQYLFKIFSNEELSETNLHERQLLIHAWTEVLVTLQKQKKVSSFPNSECKYLYVELAFDALQINLVHKNILGTWLDFLLAVIDIFGLKFEQRLDDIAEKAIEYTKTVRPYYQTMSLKGKSVVLTIVLKIMQELRPYYEENDSPLSQLLEEIGPIVDFEHFTLEDEVWKKFKAQDLSASELLGPWALVIAIANYLLTLKNCQKYTVWLANRKYLDRMIECTCELLSYKDALSAGKMALYSLTLYVQSPLAYDFLKVNMLRFFDRVEPMVNALLTGQLSKVIFVS